MFMFSFRLRRLPVFLGGVALVLVVLLGIMGVRTLFAPDTTPTGATTQRQSSKKISGKTNEERVAFLTAFGWEIEEEPLEILEVIIPKEFDAVYEAYNDLQKAQGFDLSEKAGSRCKRYAYRINNYPGTEEAVRVHVLVHKNVIIGGDVCSEVAGSFLHGFKLPG